MTEPIKLEIFNLGENLVPFIEWFDIHRAQILAPLFQQIGEQMAANETAAAANHNFLCLHNLQTITRHSVGKAGRKGQPICAGAWQKNGGRKI